MINFNKTFFLSLNLINQIKKNNNNKLLLQNENLPIIGHWKKIPLVANGPGTSTLVFSSSEHVNVSMFWFTFFLSASNSFLALDLMAANELKTKNVLT